MQRGGVVRLLMVAPPGAGKGTQATRLSVRYGIEHIASGELLRREIAEGSQIGLRADDLVKRGDLVPDDLVLDMVGARMIEAAAGGGYVLDGWPRNLSQAESAYQLASQLEDVALQAVLHLKVDRDELIRRLRSRAHVEGRDDDTEETIAHRLEVFDSQTEPLLGFYAERGILHTVDGSLPPDDVEAELTVLLGRLDLL
jgi:adenylate kinase